ncbi:MAG: phosphopantetheine-binding protein [Pseudomonadota bacterium]
MLKRKIARMEELILKLKKEIIENLNLEDFTPEELEAEAPLFGEGLGLDSIDALELMVLLEKNYGLKIEDPKQGRKVFYSIKTMAAYILEHQKK